MCVAGGRDLTRVSEARENNLKDVGVEIPKCRLTEFTEVSGPGRSSWSLTRSPPSDRG